MNAIQSAPRFHQLRVASIIRETPEAVSIGFEIPPELAQDYRFAAGQYLTLRKTIKGEEIRRSYSICTAPGDHDLRVAVKQIENGLFSGWVNQQLKPGDMIEVMTPTGRFGLAHAPGNGRHHVAFAAGSGITPVLSIIRDVLAREPDSDFTLFYGNRATETILFRTALDDLKDEYLSRLTVYHILSREQQDVAALNGYIDAEKVRKWLQDVVPAARIDHAFVCGPEAMLETVEAALHEAGVAAAKIHTERFVSAHGGKPQPKPVIDDKAPPAHIATLIVDGKQRDVPVAEGEAVLDAALRAGMDLPFACKGGMCSTCRARVLEGEVEMALNYALEPWETEAGFVLTCQSHAKTPRVVIDYDQV